MKAKYRFLLAVIVLGLLMTGPFMVTFLLVWLDMCASGHAEMIHLLLSYLPTGIVVTG